MQADEIRAIRHRHGIGTKRMAAVLGIAQSSYQLWEQFGVTGKKHGLARTLLVLIRDHPQVWRWLCKLRES